MDKKVYWFMAIQVLINIILFLCLDFTFGEVDKMEKEYKIQIDSLWNNVQQLQDEYSKIIDIVYNPYFKIPYNVGE